MKKLILAASLALFVGQANAICTQPGYVPDPNNFGRCKQAAKPYNGSDKGRYGESQKPRGKSTYDRNRSGGKTISK